MPENRLYPPEGLRPPVSFTLDLLRRAMEEQTVLEDTVLRCDAALDLHLKLDGISAVIPRQESVAPWMSGSARDISILARVGKQTCFTVTNITSDPKGAPVVHLSRRMAQELAMEHFLKTLKAGSVVSGRIVRMERYGVFVDIGCGIIALLPTEQISVSRISHPKERFREGQKLLAAVLRIDPERKRFTLTHKELLGTWMDNAALFAHGETVRGIVRSTQEYGAFIELTPNLSGLCDPYPGLAAGDAVSVYIKSIRPERMKVKLQVIEKLPSCEAPPLHYLVTDGVLECWHYSPPGYEKEPVITDFTAL